MTKIYGHRGAKGDYPENTLLAFKKALEAGAKGIELDVHVTKDGELVVHHDATLNRTTTGTGYIRDYTLVQLKELSAGAKFADFEKYEESWDKEKIPTLKETLELLASYGAELNIELKTYEIEYPNIEEKLLKEVKEANYPKDVVYSSFHFPTLIRLQKLDSTAKIAFLTEMPVPFPLDYIETFGLEALHIDVKTVVAHQAHFRPVADKLRVWTVNDEKDMRTLLDMEVNAIITDCPDLAVSLSK